MDTYNEYILKYHNGGSLLREGEVKYVNGNVAESAIDLDKVCYWYLLGNLKKFNYDIKKVMDLFYEDDLSFRKKGGVLLG